MFPTYLSFSLWDRGKGELIVTLLFILNPILAYITPIIYYMGIGFTISCTFTIDLMRIIAWSMKNENVEIRKYNNSKKTQSSPNNLIHVLPEKIMVFSAIRRKSEFVGYLYKMGIHFLGFMDSLRNIGINTIFICMLLGLR